jgi:hypothetical protein
MLLFVALRGAGEYGRSLAVHGCIGYVRVNQCSMHDIGDRVVDFSNSGCRLPSMTYLLEIEIREH